MIEQYIKNMNDKQALAVQSTEGPVLIMAGAGSGKTRVLTHRVAYLIEDKGVLPWRILAITFTNKAAKEMKERIAKLVDATLANDIWVSTFHALCVRILRRDGQAIGLDRNFTIISPTSQKTLIKNILSDLNYDSKIYEPKNVLGEISNAKNAMLNPTEYLSKAKSDFQLVTGEVYKKYQKELLRNQSVDFDDLISKTIELFKTNPDILEKYQNQFQYIHVDEYQDTNMAQYTIVNMLAQKHQNLCVVGDADQSIYAWRGADMQNILNFEKDWPNSKTILLEQNYRSTQNILDAANNVIANNSERKPKKLWTQNNAGELINYYSANDEKMEASFVVEEIKKLVRSEKYSYGDCAVLFRSNVQSSKIEDSLLLNNIKYDIVGAFKFYERLEILDVLAYMQLLNNPDDNISFERVINTPKRSIGAKTLEKLRLFADTNNMSYMQAIESIELVGLSPKATKTLLEFAETIIALHRESNEMSLSDLYLKMLDKTGYKHQYEVVVSEETENRLANIDELYAKIKDFETNYVPNEDSVDMLTDFLISTTLNTDLDNLVDSSEKVTLMTLHAAKGLEFPVVFIIGMEEGLFPTFRAINNGDLRSLEEERRLAYVGITRAEKKLYLTSAKSRYLYGRDQRNMASRFIKEINPELLNVLNTGVSQTNSFMQRESKYPFANNTTSSKTTTSRVLPKRVVTPKVVKTNVSYAINDNVKHKKYGNGVIIKVAEDVDSGQLITIKFEESDRPRTFSSNIAPIEKI